MENECKILAASKLQYEPRMIDELARIITQARALAIKANSPKIWNDLTELLSGTMTFDYDFKSSNAIEYRKAVKKIWPNFKEKERRVAIGDALTLKKVLMRRGFYINAQDSVDETTR